MDSYFKITGSYPYKLNKSSENTPWRINTSPIDLDIKWTLTGSKGPLIILINGFQEGNNPNSKIVKTLSQFHRVLMVDIPGHINGKPPLLSFTEEAKIINSICTSIKDDSNIDFKSVNVVAFSLGGFIALALAEIMEINNLMMIGTPSGSSPDILKYLLHPKDSTTFAKLTTPSLNPRIVDLLGRSMSVNLTKDEEEERVTWCQMINRDHIIGAIPKKEFNNIDITSLLKNEILIPFCFDEEYYQVNYVKLEELNLIDDCRNIIFSEFTKEQDRDSLLNICERYNKIAPRVNNFIYCHGEMDPLVCRSTIKGRIHAKGELKTHKGGHFVTLQREVKIEDIIEKTLINGHGVAI